MLKEKNSREKQNHIYLGQITSLCEECLQLVPAKILFEGNNVYYRKHCKAHGFQKTLVSDDREYFNLCKDYLKPGDVPKKFQTSIHYGCPFDCGLCPDHEQHSCLGIIEICEECNLHCPICFNDSGPNKGKMKSLEEIARIMDNLVLSEGEPDLVQISGGEPTLHPDILKIIMMAKERPMRHVMINTNGVRIASDEAFVQELAKLKKGFEVYLQFDSLRPNALKKIRGANLMPIREKALAMLEKYGISTTLVCVVAKGANEDEMNEIIEYALKWKCVRGVTFQPVELVGRTETVGKGEKVLVSQIRRAIYESSPYFKAKDIIPLPCHPESIAIGYGIRTGSGITPVTSLISRETLLEGVENAITFEKNAALKKEFFKVFSLDSCGVKGEMDLKSMLCCLPKIEAPTVTYADVFRVVIIGFMDKYDFDVGSVKRSCIHFVTEDKIYPFETYNLFHRPGLEKITKVARSGSFQRVID